MRTIHAAAEDIREGRLSPVDLLDECLERVDRLEPRVRAWVLLDRDGARETAKLRHEEARRGQWRGPLHGIPLGIKDIFDVFDWPTACGSKLWANSIARHDADVVTSLREAGAVLMGKTVTTMYASFDPPVTRNPWNLERTPGGSSSGSAAAVACGMCLGALGSQTGGSITRPASYCGVAGMKPTFGRVSVEGVLPLAASMDHVGPMARCVRDLAILFDTMCIGWDRSQQRLARFTRPLPTPCFAWIGGLFATRATRVMRERFEDVLQQLRKAGTTIEEASLPPAFGPVLERHRTVMAVEAAAYHEPRLRRHPEDYGPCIRTLLEEGLATPAPEFDRVMDHKKTLHSEMRFRFFGREGTVALCPATTGPAPAADTTGDPAFNSPWSYTGLPTVNVPIGRSPDGLPLALQLVGNHEEEATLLEAAAWCEEVLNVDLGEPRGVV
jgi:aspartyl-tRNA(Asn)/glutamyl-tRNA(Gln) amidotransferase subunit A